MLDGETAVERIATLALDRLPLARGEGAFSSEPFNRLTGPSE
jgi:hypothetical protein